MTLDRLKPGQSGVISIESAVRARCAEGCWTWADPQNKGERPQGRTMGDPIELYLRGYVLTIRAEDAANIEIGEVTQ